MFDDSKRHLRRMEEALQEEDDRWLDEELEDAKRLLDPEADADCPKVSVTNNDRLDVDLDAYSDDVFEQPPKEKGIRGLVILACLEALAIAAVILYWLVMLL